jgi:hypothetical protein
MNLTLNVEFKKLEIVGAHENEQTEAAISLFFSHFE